MSEDKDRRGTTGDQALVCIVDDDALVRKALGRLVKAMGMRAEVYASPSELLEQGSADSFCCLLLDVQLPGMTGFELRRRLAARGGRAPVIFITGHPDDAARSQAAEAGAVALLEKPFDEQRLLDALEQALDRHVSGQSEAGRP
jgi:FixJ family two-component response regulator